MSAGSKGHAAKSLASWAQPPQTPWAFGIGTMIVPAAVRAAATSGVGDGFDTPFAAGVPQATITATEIRTANPLMTLEPMCFMLVEQAPRRLVTNAIGRERRLGWLQHFRR